MLSLEENHREFVDAVFHTEIPEPAEVQKETFHAVLVSIGQEVDETSRSLEMYARVKETNPRFRPGMYVSARVEKK